MDIAWSPKISHCVHYGECAGWCLFSFPGELCCGTQQLEHRRCLLSKSRIHCPGFRCLLRLSLLINSSNMALRVHERFIWEWGTATSVRLLCSAFIPPSRIVRAGITLSSPCRYRTEAGMPARNSCHLNHPLEMSLSLYRLGERWHS